MSDQEIPDADSGGAGLGERKDRADDMQGELEAGIAAQFMAPDLIDQHPAHAVWP